MLYILLAVAGLMIVFFAARYSRFRHIAEPVLSVLVGLGLVSAFLVWLNDDSRSSPDAAPPVAADARGLSIDKADIELVDLSFTQGSPANSYAVTGTIRNDSTLFLDYFDLQVTLRDCPQEACVDVGRDEALVLARIPPGVSAPLRAALVFPDRRVGPPTAPRFEADVANIRALPAGN